MIRFLVIEGLDGSGKSTQVRLLREYLEQNGMNFEYLHFPRTDSPVYGDLVARFLRGELGDINQVNPYLIALIYAGDRNDAAKLIREWIAQDTFVLVDRYVYSNIAFQCAKLEDHEERKKLRDWILHLEFEYNGIPVPDLSLFLDVPFTFTQKSLQKDREGDDRAYLKGHKDIHEADLNFQKKVRDVYAWQAETGSLLKRIDCADERGAMLPPEKIFECIKNEITT